jgi:4-diphosphocytidyl-2-C-methyl-D-erythritol kinase
MSKAPTCVRVQAPAKINLTLRVLGTHPDGYHELRTMFQSLALHDTLTFRAAPGPFVIECRDPRCPTDASNLVWKAAELLWRAARHRRAMGGVRVEIRKRIPQQAGLGGGSSDAAASLRALNLLWQLSMSDDRLSAIARDIGADVAYFLEGGTVLGVDRGDVLFPLQDRQDAAVVLVLPDFGVSTKDAYGWWDAARESVLASSKPGRRTVSSEWVNDLQGPVTSRHPVIGSFVSRLRRAGAFYAAMSGSGSALFGLFDAREGADAAEACRVCGPSYRLTVCTTSCSPLLRSAFQTPTGV